MKAWQWYDTDKQLPKITNDDGTSDYVLAFPGSFLPQVVKYSNGSCTKRGWWTTDLRFLSMRVGGRCSTQQRFPFWSHIEHPTFENLLKQEEGGLTMYIRFGEIPEDERSGVYHAGELANKEEGVSVYDAKIDDWGNVAVCLPLPINANTLDTFRNLVEYENRPCYLVNGDYIGKGSDNEPLIRNVSIVKKIKYREKNWDG